MPKNLVVGATALALILGLSACTYIDAGAKDIKRATTDNTVGENMVTGKKVEVGTGSYTRVKVSDDYINTLSASHGESDDVKIQNVTKGGPSLDTNLGRFEEVVYKFYFSDFIDSTALEGGKKDLAAWAKMAVSSGKLADNKRTKAWASDPEYWPILTTHMMTEKPGALDTLIHDGKPRVSDADLAFKKFDWGETQDAMVVTAHTLWSVDYRVSDDTVFKVLKAKNPEESDAAIRKEMTAEAQDGKGENTFRVSGKTDWDIRVNEGSEPLSLLSSTTQAKYSLESSVKPEFRDKAKAGSK